MPGNIFSANGGGGKVLSGSLEQDKFQAAKNPHLILAEPPKSSRESYHRLLHVVEAFSSTMGNVGQGRRLPVSMNGSSDKGIDFTVDGKTHIEASLLPHAEPVK